MSLTVSDYKVFFEYIALAYTINASMQEQYEIDDDFFLQLRNMKQQYYQ